MKPTDYKIAQVERELFRDLAIPDPLRRELRARLDVLLLAFAETAARLTRERDALKQVWLDQSSTNRRIGALIAENRALRETLRACEEYLALRPAETPQIRALIERIREAVEIAS